MTLPLEEQGYRVEPEAESAKGFTDIVIFPPKRKLMTTSLWYDCVDGMPIVMHLRIHVDFPCSKLFLERLGREVWGS